MSKDKLKEEFKRLAKKDQKELIQEYMTHDNFSTDDDDHEIHSKNPINIDKGAVIGDKWGHCELSYAIEDGNIERVKQIYQLQEKLNDADLLKRIAVDIMDRTIQDQYSIDEKVVFEICSGIEYQLRLMGEGIEDIILTYSEE